jgi:hypothetical protein
MGLRVYIIFKQPVFTRSVHTVHVHVSEMSSATSLNNILRQFK